MSASRAIFREWPLAQDGSVYVAFVDTSNNVQNRQVRFVQHQRCDARGGGVAQDRGRWRRRASVSHSSDSIDARAAIR